MIACAAVDDHIVRPGEGGQNLLLGGKARAALDGRHFVTTSDIRAVAHPVLRHRVLTNFTAESEGITPDVVIDRLQDYVSAEEADNAVPPELAQALA